MIDFSAFLPLYLAVWVQAGLVSWRGSSIHVSITGVMAMGVMAMKGKMNGGQTG